MDAIGQMLWFFDVWRTLDYNSTAMFHVQESGLLLFMDRSENAMAVHRHWQGREN